MLSFIATMYIPCPILSQSIRIAKNGKACPGTKHFRLRPESCRHNKPVPPSAAKGRFSFSAEEYMVIRPHLPSQPEKLMISA